MEQLRRLHPDRFPNRRRVPGPDTEAERRVELSDRPDCGGELLLVRRHGEPLARPHELLRGERKRPKVAHCFHQTGIGFKRGGDRDHGF